MFKRQRTGAWVGSFFLAMPFSFLLFGNATAGIPTIDVTNVTQTTVSALNAVEQTAQQIDQYKKQLQQYETQLRNSLHPSQYIWNQAQSTMNKLINSLDLMDYYTTQAGSIDSYLRNFEDLDYYVNSPCYSGAGCTAEARNTIRNARIEASASQKQANDALIHSIKDQQDSIRDDAKELNNLQSAAQGAEGQMAAIQYANQLASQQTGQLLQVRALMLAQAQAQASRDQSKASEDAREQAAAAQLRSGTYSTGSNQEW